MKIHRCIQLLFLLLTANCLIPHFAQAQPKTTTITNFDDKGRQVTKFGKLGDAVDAHDGEIAYFDGIYYLYGTSYGCGFEWGHKDAPFCGFKSYSSTDMVNWTDRGELFDASTPVWQTRCNGNTYGCFRPHVIYNKKTALYVLWINVYDNRVGYRVFTSKTPTGPFVEQAEPKLAINNDSPVAGLNNGDHDTFVDDDGTAYLAYTDWHAKGAIAIEQLSDNYLTGTGKVVKAITKSETEAPGLFKRKGIYYLVYSDPNCGYCSGTGASYRTAKSPLGPWSDGTRISDNSCGGQPSFVSSIKLKTGEVFLFGSDLWNNGAKNESLANYYWAPLSFNADGSIKPIVCQNTVAVPSSTKTILKSLSTNFAPVSDINKGAERSQTFKVTKSGLLSTLSIAAFKNGYPDAGLVVEIKAADETQSKILSSTTLPATALSWSPSNIIIRPKIYLVAGKSYMVTIRSATAAGSYGLEYDTADKDKFLYHTIISSKPAKLMQL
jgi:hypothetical protein